jgi:hypothetical protein
MNQNQCKYLMVLETRFCRLKGQTDPKCEHCTIHMPLKVEQGKGQFCGLRRIKI